MSKESGLTLGSLFDGSGGFPLAGIIAGVTPLWASEIEPFAVRVTTKRLPQMKHYGDVSSLSGADLPPVDIITFGSPCFPAGTLVLTDSGYLPIEEVTVGMKVLTHMGRWRKVTATGSKQGETVILRGNHYGLECTPNHPIYSAEVQKYYPQLENGKRGNIRLVGKEKKWTPAEEMQGKLWCVPLKTEYLPMEGPHYSGDPHQKPMPEMNEDFFYFVGRWLGDGWLRNTQRSGRPNGQLLGQIILCDSPDKENELREIVEKLTVHYHVEHCRTGVKFRFCGQVLCSWLKENFGEYSHGKKIPAWVYSLPRKKQEALMKGFLDSDGYQSGEHMWKVTSVSKKLVEGMRILAEILGYSTTVYHDKRPKHGVIESRTVNQRDTYVLSLIRSDRVEHLTDELHGWYLVRKVIPTHEIKTVYNMTVDEDNSYVADGIVVHNCQDMSIAGKRDGLDGSRSSLFYEAIRIVKEMREKTNGEKPRFIVWENVPGAFSSNKGQDFKAVLEAVIGVKEPAAKVPAPEKRGWPNADYYVGDGWSVAYRVLDAQWWGVPQRRARIFLVADFAGQSAPEILFESEGVSGYTPQGFRSWQGAAGDPPEGAGETGGRGSDGYSGRTAGGVVPGKNGIVLNDQGGNRMDVTEEVTCTLRAEAHHPPVVLDEPQAAGFCTEHSAKSRSIGYEEEKSPTLRAGIVPAAVARDVIPLEHHPTDSRIGIEEGNAIQTLTSRMGTGGNNVPLIMMPNGLSIPFVKGTRPHSAEEAPTWKEGETANTLNTFDVGESRCNELVVEESVAQPVVSVDCRNLNENEEVSGTLQAKNTGGYSLSYINPVAFGISSVASNGMKSDNPKVGFYEAETSKTLDISGGNPSCNQGGVCVCEPVAFAVQGSMIGRAEKNGPQGDGVNEDVSFTLNTVDHHAVAYSASKASFFTEASEERANTLVASDYKDSPIVNDTDEPYYIVRRLTPVECARLQGFPDWWCSDLGISDPTEEDIRFWSEVWETHRRIMGTSKKSKTEKQIVKWLKEPHSDSAEYKLWGNGIPLPIVYFILSGIVWAALKE